MSRISNLLDRLADQNGDGDFDRDDALILARRQIANSLGLNENDRQMNAIENMTTRMVVAAGLVRENTNEDDSFFGQIFHNDDLIRGIVTLAITTGLRAAGITLPGFVKPLITQLIERVLDRLKKRKAQKPETPSQPTPGPQPPETTVPGKSEYLPNRVFDAPIKEDSELIALGYVAGVDWVFVGGMRWGVAAADQVVDEKWFTAGGFTVHHRIGG